MKLNPLRVLGGLLVLLSAGILMTTLEIHRRNARGTTPRVLSEASTPSPRDATDPLHEGPGASARIALGPIAPPTDRTESAVGSPGAPSLTTAVRGLVRDLNNHPRADVNVVDERRPSEILAVSADDGMFALAALESRACLVARAPGLSSVLKHCSQGDEKEARAVLVVAPSVNLEGRVVGPSGGGIGGCVLWLLFDEAVFASLEIPLDSTSFTQHWTKTSENGSFSLSGVPTGNGLRLRLTRRGFQESHVEVPRVDQKDLVFTLDPDAQSIVLRGFVRLSTGHPAEDAFVRAEDFTEARTDATGAFSLRINEPSSVTSVRAWKAGYLPAEIASVGSLLADPERAGDPIELVLGDSTLSIRGRLLDSGGTPQSGWELSLVQGTEISQHKLPPEYLEDRIGAQARPIRTGEAGEFLVDGLLARAYRLHIADPTTKANFESDAIEAGTQDAILTIPGDLLRATLAGRVVSPEGSAIAGVEVTASADRRTSTGFTTTKIASSRTDSEGRFQLSRIPRRSLVLSVSGESVVPMRQLIPEDTVGDDVEIRAYRRCYVRLNCTSKPEADSLSVLDASGEQQLIWLAAQMNTIRAPIKNGASSRLMVDERVTTLVVYRGELELGRIPFRPKPGEDSVVDF